MQNRSNWRVIAAVLVILFSSFAAHAQTRNLTVAVLVNSTNTTGYNTSATTPGLYQKYAERYFENFQIPYQVINVSNTAPPADLSNRQLIIAAHPGLALSSTWQNAIIAAVNGGAGFVNLDSDSAIGNSQHIKTIFGATTSVLGTASTSITVPAALAGGGSTPHYIAALQLKTIEQPGDFIYNFHADQGGTLRTATATLLKNGSGPIAGTVIANLGTDPLVTATTYGGGRAINFGTLDYLQADRFGFLMGLDDIFWRSLVWAARKPFSLRGYPRFWAVRMDHNVDTDFTTRIREMYTPSVTGNTVADGTPWGTGGPWKVTVSAYLNFLTPGDANRDSLISDMNAGKIQLSPHGFHSVTYGDLFWAGTDSPAGPLTDSEWLTNITAIQQFQQGNGGADKIPSFSKWWLGHFYDLSNNLGSDLYNTFGVRYIGTTDKPGNVYTTDPTQAGYQTERFNAHPYWVYQVPPKPAGVFASDESYSFFFADDLTIGSRAGLPAQKFFLIGSRTLDPTLSTIPDMNWCDPQGNGAPFATGKFQWYAWRLFSSLVPAEAFTHDDAYVDCLDSSRQQIIAGAASFLNAHGSHNIYMQDMAQYVYARTKSTLSQASYNGTNVTYTFTGKAADADGTLVSTQLLVFAGDTEGTWQSVPGFSNGLVTSLAPPPAPPTVVSVNPPSGPSSGGTSVTISGSGFTSSSAVLFGTVSATSVSFISSSTLVAVAPAAGSLATVDVTVNTAFGSGKLTGGYTYVGAPIISRISPTSGPSTGGTLLNIYGTSFSSATQITVGGLSATSVTFVSPTLMTAVAPANVVGTTATVTATNSFGAGSLANAYTYLNASTILLQDSFNSGSLGNWTASPLGLLNNWSASQNAADYNGGGATQLYAGTNNWNNYTFEAKVRLFSLQNYPGGIRGRVNTSTGTSYAVWLYPGSNSIKLFKVAGWNIDQFLVSTLASATLSFDATNFHTIDLTFQGSSITVAWDGAVVMTATDSSYLGGGVAFDVSNQHIQFEDVLVTGTASTGPFVTGLSLSPSAFTMGTNGATQQLTATATMSDGTTQNVTNSAATTYSSSNTSFATVNTTGLVTAVGVGTATITASNGGSTATATATVAITSPTITRVSPASGSTAGGDHMDVYGANLTTSSIVTIGGQNASVLSALSDSSRVTVLVPASSAAGSANVVVSNPGNTNTGTLSGGYTYLTPSSILFQDSFNSASLSNWTASPMGLFGNWTATPDAADYNGGGHTQIYAGNSSWTDYSVEARFDVFTSSNYPGGLRGRVNTSTGQGYEAWILPGSNTIVLYRAAGWSIDTPGLTSLGQATVTSMNPNVFHVLKLSFSGSQVNVIYDGTTIITATDSTLPSGAIALDVSNQHIQFDDVIVTQP